MEIKYIKADSSFIEESILLKKEVVIDLAKHNLPLWNEEYPSDNLIKEDIEKGEARLLINKDNNEVIGYIHLCDPKTLLEWEYDFKNPDLFYIGRLMIKPSFQGQHLSSYLLKEVIKEVKSLNKYKGIGLYVEKRNISALNLYQKNGFILTDISEYEDSTYLTYELLF